MSIQVNEFYHIPGKNDAEYIKLLKEHLEAQKQLTFKAIAKIKELSKSAKSNSSESPNNWIPCSMKKHPDSKIECYVTVKDYTDDYGEEYDLIVDVDTYSPEDDSWDYYCDLDVIAWMPKNEPEEPYQEVEE